MHVSVKQYMLQLCHVLPFSGCVKPASSIIFSWQIWESALACSLTPMSNHSSVQEPDLC